MIYVYNFLFGAFFFWGVLCFIDTDLEEMDRYLLVSLWMTSALFAIAGALS